MSTRVLYIHWDDWWKSCSQNWTAFANWDIFLLNISLSIPHIMLTLLLFVILITCSHHLRSNYYITIYIIIKNIFLVHQGRARKQFFASGAGCSYYRDWGLVLSEIICLEGCKSSGSKSKSRFEWEARTRGEALDSWFISAGGLWLL